MRVLFWTTGSRGDVQRVEALASHLKALGYELRVCASRLSLVGRRWAGSLRPVRRPRGRKRR
jgi:hypothetical protein